jgi:hypothetical protein
LGWHPELLLAAAAAAEQDIMPRDAQAMGLLQLAVNSSSAAAASTAVGLLSEVLGPDLLSATRELGARRLLVTAAVRGHLALVDWMTTLGVVQRSVDAATWSIVLERVVLHRGSGLYGGGNALEAVVGMTVEQQPTMQQLDVSTVADLLQVAVWMNERDARDARDSVAVASQLCRLVGGDGLVRGDGVQQLLLAAIGMRIGWVVWEALPGQVQLSLSSTAEVLPLLLAAVEKRDESLISRLCMLPAAGHLTSRDVLQLLRAEAKHRNPMTGTAQLLCAKPAAQQLSRGDVVDLLRRGVARGNHEYLSAISSLPAAQQLDRSVVEQLMHEAVQQGAYVQGCLNVLKWLLR